MFDPNDICCLIKFGSQKNIQNLIKFGEICFNSPKKYNDLKDQESESGDQLEGAEWIINGHFKIEANHPTIGKTTLMTNTDQSGRLIQYNHNYLSCSFMAITPPLFDKKATFQIDKRNLKLKEAKSAILIKEPINFLNSVCKKLKETNSGYEVDLVKYKDLSSVGRHEVNPFVKKLEHQHQNEFRIIIDDPNEKRIIQIGSIKHYSEVFTAKEMQAMIWRIKR